MAKKMVRRRKGRRLLFVALLGGATWYMRSRQMAGSSPGLADQPPTPPRPAPTPRPTVTPRLAVTPRPAPTPQPVAEPEQEPQPLFTPAATVAESPTNGVAAAAVNGAASDPAAAAAPQAVVDIPAEAAPSLPDGSSPGPDYTIKGNAGSKLFHLPTSPYYERTKAEMWFRSADEARAAGFTEWASPKRARRKRVTR